MYQTIEKHFEEFVKSNNITNTEFKEVDLRDFLGKVMLDWISLLLFGFSSAEELKIDLNNHPDILNGEYRTHSLKNTTTNLVSIAAFFIEESLDMFKDVFNKTLFGLPFALGVKKVYRSHKILKEFLYNEIKKVYLKRYNESENSEAKIMNVLDLQIQHNKKCEIDKNFEDLIPEELMITNIIAFFVAGYDTSLQASMSGIMNMAQKRPDWISKIKNDSVKNIEDIQKNYSLDLAIKEI